MSDRLLRNFTAALAVSILVACGGSGAGGNKAPTNATVRGAIQGFTGGLQINGVTFRTTGAQLRLPDDPASQVVLGSEDAVKGHLDDGMVVTVRGTIDGSGTNGQAAEIEFHDLMEATIDDKAAGQIRVLGVDLSIDDATHIEDHLGNPLTLGDLANGERVEVSGHGDAKGGARASFIRLRDDVAAGVEREAKGWVVAISGAILDLALTKGGPVALHVDISGVASPPAIAVGDFVEVKTMGPPDASGNVVASAIDLENELEAEPQDEVEVEGIISAVASGEFTLGGQRVIPDANVTFEGGTADDLVVGVEAEAEGTLGADGALHAQKVKFEAGVRLDANLAASDPAAGTLTLIGITVHVTPSTELRSFAAPGDLNLGDRLEVRGFPTRDGLGINATRIERLATAPSDRAFLRALVTAKTPNTSLTLLGIAVDVSSAAFSGSPGSDAASFFAAITEGKSLVKVRWRPYPVSTSEPVDEAELEN